MIWKGKTSSQLVNKPLLHPVLAIARLFDHAEHPVNPVSKVPVTDGPVPHMSTYFFHQFCGGWRDVWQEALQLAMFLCKLAGSWPIQGTMWHGHILHHILGIARIDWQQQGTSPLRENIHSPNKALSWMRNTCILVNATSKMQCFNVNAGKTAFGPMHKFPPQKILSENVFD